MQNTYLDYTYKFFHRLNINTNILNLNQPLPDNADLGLRHAILGATSPLITDFNDIDKDFLKKNILYLLTDQYECRYILIPIPDQESATVLFAGPYLLENAGIYRTNEICDRLKIPEALRNFINQYYSTLPFIGDSSVIECYLDTLCEFIYGAGNYRIEYIKQASQTDSGFLTTMDSNNNEDIMERLEYRYGLEEKVIDAISRGDFNTAMKYSTDQALRNIDNRSSNTLRSKKNNMLAFNTICRKGAERGNVHPIHLDEMSRRMAIKIENMTSPDQDKEVHREILKRYCTMVQHNSTTGYSPTMQRVINYVSQNLLDTELTLQKTAEELSLNKSYLATLFKKETGETFTKYVNGLRIRHAIFLLNSTNLPIQSIASTCGIPDVTYFTRLFQKEKGMSPSQYRKMIMEK